MRRFTFVFVGLALALAVGAAAEETEPAFALDEHRRKVFSQYGEDGVIERIFELIEPTRKYVVEFGAHDGVTNSNARNLILNHGWGGYLIEGDPARAKELAKTYAGVDGVTTQQAWIYPGNIEILFEEAGVPTDVDLVVIDIDSNDYYVWRAIHTFRPKVIMIEANLRFPPPQLMVVDFHPMNYWDRTPYHGASIQSYYNLAKKKGYELIYCLHPGPNVFFVDKQYFDRFGIEDNSPVKLFRKRMQPATPLISPGQENLHWDAFDIKKTYLHHR